MCKTCGCEKAEETKTEECSAPKKAEECCAPKKTAECAPKKSGECEKS